MPKRIDDPAAAADPALGSVDPAHHPPKAFSDADWAWFTSRCTALEIPDPESRRAAFEALYGHLVGVNRWLNLTKLIEPRDYLKQHLLDSLSLVSDKRLRHLAEGTPCIDLGSGGGYPGLPLALWSPRIPWVLVDARRKKCDFLAAAGQLLASFCAPLVTAKHVRGIDTVRDPLLYRRAQLVVSRAMGPTSEVLAEAEPLLRSGGHLIVYKGPAYPGDEESAALKACKHFGFRAVSKRLVQLEDGDPDRVQVVFQRQ